VHADCVAVCVIFGGGGGGGGTATVQGLLEESHRPPRVQEEKQQYQSSCWAGGCCQCSFEPCPCSMPPTTAAAGLLLVHTLYPLLLAMLA